jgi:CRP/FNR family transcriptional regulator, cyclic AMP receptor protein
MGDRTVLRDLALFAGCSADDLSVLLAGSEELDVEQGEVVVREGRHDHEFYVVLEGSARVVRDGSSLARLDPGDFFGEGALLSGRPRNASVIALTDMRVLVVPEERFGDLLARVPGFSAAVRLGPDGRSGEPAAEG